MKLYVGELQTIIWGADSGSAESRRENDRPSERQGKKRALPAAGNSNALVAARNSGTTRDKTPKVVPEQVIPLDKDELNF